MDAHYAHARCIVNISLFTTFYVLVTYHSASLCRVSGVASLTLLLAWCASSHRLSVDLTAHLVWRLPARADYRRALLTSWRVTVVPRWFRCLPLYLLPVILQHGSLIMPRLSFLPSVPFRTHSVFLFYL
jgi:hypothetical protein